MFPNKSEYSQPNGQHMQSFQDYMEHLASEFGMATRHWSLQHSLRRPQIANGVYMINAKLYTKF